MKTLYRTATITLLIALASFAHGTEVTKSLLVSVHTIESAQQSPSKYVEITFQVHAPVEARNSNFLTISSSTDRTKVRSEFPLGGLFFVEVPTDFLSKLKKQKTERLKYEIFIDTGADPQRISQQIEIPEIDFPLIEKTMIEYGQNPNQSEISIPFAPPSLTP